MNENTNLIDEHNEGLTPIEELSPFKRMVLSLGTLPSAFYDTMTYYESLVYFYEYLKNEVIPTVNNNGEAVEELQTKYIELKEFIDNYFDNLDVQEEINQKLDEMVLDGTLTNLISGYVDPIYESYETEINESIQNQNNEITNFKTSINNQISEINTKVDQATSGSPLTASSTSEMTDTTRIYVNTSNGYWYYYDGDSWEQGGIYQSTGIADGSVTPIKTSFNKDGKNIFDSQNYQTINAYFNRTTPLTSSSDNVCVYIPCTANTSYEIYSDVAVDALYAGYTTTIPTIGLQPTMTFTTSYGKKTSCIPTSDGYLIVHVKNSRDNADLQTILNGLIISQNTYLDLNGSYKNLDIKNEDLTDNNISPEKITFNKNSNNLLDYKNNLITYYRRNNNALDIGTTTKFIFVPCESNKEYTIYRDEVVSARYGAGYIDYEPAVNVAINGWTENNNGKFLYVTTGNNAKYLCIYYLNIEFNGTANEENILKGMAVIEGHQNQVEVLPHKILSVEEYNLSSSLKEKLINNINPYTSKSMVFGVEFDLSTDDPDGERIGSITDLTTNYYVGNNPQNAKNDFDSIYPWSDIKLCNLQLNNDGSINKITYEDDPEFTRDGTNGNVMVEIPKFYTMRKIENNKLTIAISGSKQGQFELEPVFKNGDKELDYIYIGAYSSKANSENGIFSISGVNPIQNTSLYNDITKYNSFNFTVFDFACQLAIQALFTVEFATFNNKATLNGVGWLPYYYTGNTLFLITDIPAPNKVTVLKQDRLENIVVGNLVGFGHTEGNINVPMRTITNITDNTTTLTFTYNGDDLSASLTANVDSVFGIPQTNGMTDSINYHTGRIFNSNGVSPFKYRHLENIWGNQWIKTGGLKLKNLEYYYTFDTNDYNKTVNDSSANWQKVSYLAPLQPTLTPNNAWIVKEGYDYSNKRISLPTLAGVSQGGGAGKYYCSGIYTYNGTDTEYTAAISGPWDSADFASIYNTRLIIDQNATYPEDAGWHYGSRIVYRK